MHGLHARLPKTFDLEERLERYADVIEKNPESLRGHWAEACAPVGAAPFSRVCIDLGCGKGLFTCAMAKAHPDALFVAIDTEPICVVYAAGHIDETGLTNAVVVPGTGMKLDAYFAPAEVDAIYINFPTPFPRKRQAHLRVTNSERLMQYRNALVKGGIVRLKTDSQPLYDFSLEQVEAAGYRFLWQTRDVQEAFPDDIPSEYERRLGAQGAKVLGFCITPGEAPEHFLPTEHGSLVDYLPEDLESLSYLPHGMESTIQNMINRKHKKGHRHWRNVPQEP